MRSDQFQRTSPSSATPNPDSRTGVTCTPIDSLSLQHRNTRGRRAWAERRRVGPAACGATLSHLVTSARVRRRDLCIHSLSQAAACKPDRESIETAKGDSVPVLSPLIVPLPQDDRLVLSRPNLFLGGSGNPLGVRFSRAFALATLFPFPRAVPRALPFHDIPPPVSHRVLGQNVGYTQRYTIIGFQTDPLRWPRQSHPLTQGLEERVEPRRLSHVSRSVVVQH